MKQLSMMLGIAVLTAWAGTASAETVQGEVTNVSGDSITVKTADGKEKTFQSDPAAMSQAGQLSVGDQIVAQLDPQGKATSIQKQEGAGSPPDTGAGSPGGSMPEGGSPGGATPEGGSPGGASGAPQ